jgi:hypothetical protein
MNQLRFIALPMIFCAVMIQAAPPQLSSTGKLKLSAKPPTADQLIIPGLSIGRIHLGMSRKEVNAVLGTPEKATENTDQYWSDGMKNFMIIWYTPRSKVYEVMFTSPSFKTADGLNVANAEGSTANFLCGRLQWRFMNLRYLLRTGGFGVYALNIDSEDPSYYNWKIVIYEGKVPAKQPLSRDDLGETGWQSWNCQPNSLLNGLKESSVGTIGFNLSLPAPALLSVQAVSIPKEEPPLHSYIQSSPIFPNSPSPPSMQKMQKIFPAIDSAISAVSQEEEEEKN